MISNEYPLGLMVLGHMELPHRCLEDIGWAIERICPVGLWIGYDIETLDGINLPTTIRVAGSNQSRPEAEALCRTGWPSGMKHSMEWRDTKSIDPAVMKSVHTTGEHAVGLMMAAHRRITRTYSEMRHAYVAPYELYGRTAGIIGLGRIGSIVKNAVAGLGMWVIYYDPNVEGSEKTPEDVCAKSDVLFICANLHVGMVTGLERLRPDSIVVSIAARAVSPVEQVVELLRKNKIRGAAFDLPRSEFSDGIDDLYASGRLVATPHIAGSTRDAWMFTERKVLELMRSAV